jgi:hypothetical protein
MMRRLWVVLLIGACLGASAEAQKRKPSRPAPRKASPAPAPLLEPARIDCQNVLGTGVSTGRTFCDVLAGRDPLGGAVIRIPSHKGPARLTFDLHNRQMYSAELERTSRAYTQATATIGILTMDNTLIDRAVIQTEFRTARDLFDRIAAGPGASGFKAVAPVGIQPVAIELGEGVIAVSVLGEKLNLVRAEGKETITTDGRPVAVISDVKVEYRPLKPATPPRRAPRGRLPRR